MVRIAQSGLLLPILLAVSLLAVELLGQENRIGQLYSNWSRSHTQVRRQPIERPLPDEMLVDFDALYDESQLVVEEGMASIVERSGNRALQLNAGPQQGVKIRLFPLNGTWNLVDYVNLRLDLENLSTQEALIRILIKDATTTSESWYRPNLSHDAWVHPGEVRVFDALVVRNRYKMAAQDLPDYLPLFPNMHGLPHAQMLVWFGVDPTRISEVVLLLEPQDQAQTVRVDNIRANRRASPTVLEKDPEAFFPFIDIYGQYMHQRWPGKVGSDGDLIRSRELEEVELEANHRPLVFNEYGGWQDGPTLEATGHFRVEKFDGKWWLVDPVGKLFWSHGVTGVGVPGMTVDLSGKEHFYRWLPDRDHPIFGRFYTDTVPGVPTGDYYYSMFIVLFKKYGTDFEETYPGRALQRIRSWAFNTLGTWSSAADQQPEERKTPYTKIIWIPGRPVAPIGGLDDPFDPGFSNAVVTAVGWTGSKNDPYCIGFFDNNEIQWGSDPVQVVRDILEENDGSVAAKVELVNFLQGRYGSIAAANSAWGSSFSSWNALLPALGNNAFHYSGADESLVGFYDHLTDTYYRKCRDAIQLAAPDKLYLGSRIHENAMRKEVAAAAARYCDVVSFNIYERDVDEFNGPKDRDLPFFPDDKPFLVGEFNFGALDRGKFYTGIGFAADQRNRGESYVHYLKSALRNPRCVGTHWFQYSDQPTAAREKGAENSNSGLIDSTDSPYPELIEAIRSIGSILYPYRSGAELEPQFTQNGQPETPQIRMSRW